MARAVHIPATLWQRLAALDRRCNIGLVRGDWEVPGERRFVRMWRVTLSERAGPLHTMVRADGASLLQALEMALAEASKRGWLEG
jgi:hypothetical protein